MVALLVIVGPLALPVVRLLCLLRNNEASHLDLCGAGPGFTLPADIGDLDPAITELELSECNLTGLKVDIA